MSSFRTQFPIQPQRRRGVVRTPVTTPDCRTDNGSIPHPAQSLSFARTAVADAAAPPSGRAIQGHVFRGGDVNRRLLSANRTFGAGAQMRVAALTQTPTPASDPQQLQVPVNLALPDLFANHTFDAGAQTPVGALAQTLTPASNPQQLRAPVNPSLPDLFANHTFDAGAPVPVGALAQTPTPASNPQLRAPVLPSLADLSANLTFDAGAQMPVGALAQTRTPASNPQLRAPVHLSLADLSANLTFDAGAQKPVAALAQTPTPASNLQYRAHVNPSLSALSANLTFDAGAQMPVGALAQTPTPVSNLQYRAHVNPSLSALAANRTFDAGAQMPVAALAQTLTPASAFLTPPHIASLTQSHPLPYLVQATDFMCRVQYPPDPSTTTSDTFEAPPAAPVAPPAALVTSPASSVTPRESLVTLRAPPTAPVTPRASVQYVDQRLFEHLCSVIGGAVDANVAVIKTSTSSMALPTVSYGVVRDFCADTIETPELLPNCRSLLQALEADVEQSDPGHLTQKVTYLEGRFRTHHASPFAPGFSESSDGRYLREAVLLVLDMRCFLCELSMMSCDKKKSIECIYAGYELRQKYDFVFNTPQYEQFIQTAIFVGNHMGLDKQLVVCLGNELAKLHNVHDRT